MSGRPVRRERLRHGDEEVRIEMCLDFRSRLWLRRIDMRRVGVSQSGCGWFGCLSGRSLCHLNLRRRLQEMRSKVCRHLGPDLWLRCIDV